MARNSMPETSGADSPQRQSYPGKGNMGVGGKEKSEKSGQFAQGGKTHMFGEQGALPQVPGQSASPEGDDSKKFASSGSAKDVGPQKANPQQAGVSGHTTSSADQKFAQGGKTKMFGYSPSKTQTPA